jgi:hypothetical protein
MKHIKIYENFSAESELNETKETALPGGFVNVNFAGDGEDNFSYKQNVLYFETNTSDPSKNIGSPNTLDVKINKPAMSQTLSFPSDLFVDEDRNINWTTREWKKLSQPGNNRTEPSVMAKNPTEATAKAYEILAAATYLTPTPADPKAVGNLIRAFFEIRKLYPAYMTKNALFKGFLQGLIDGFSTPNFGRYAEYDDWSRNVKDEKYNDEIRKALTDAGVLRSSTT